MIVLPKFLIMRRHPILPLKLDDGVLCVVHRDNYIDFITPCNEAGNYVMLIPYQGSYVEGKPVRPIIWGDLSSIEVYALLRSELALYELSVRVVRRHTLGTALMRSSLEALVFMVMP
ncbi:hypothetical protein [Vulcanisaeta sp. JCM 14467]|uniref:hypothetical protein n=1 Tax=Vulcanisaeta sp. JCM 14467 TaxID=1295370 RepID=UPI000A472F18|nr:hypothetical protein [Vulcanisaeta sp. JCM 14467]